MTSSARNNRPRRKHKSDRLLHPGATADEMRCDMALAPFDRAMNAVEERWGIERLPELVSIETAEKWGSALAKMNAAIEAADVEDLKGRVGVCIRGLAVMEREAEAAGHRPKPAEVWEYEYEGRVFSVIRDGRDHKTLGDGFKGRRIYTMREVAIALNHLDQNLFAAVKSQFPDSTIHQIRPRPSHEGDDPDDPIPF